MKIFVPIFSLLNNSIVKPLRIIVFIILFFASIYGILTDIHPNIPLFFFSIFLIWEIFFDFKISRLLPQTLASENAQDPLDSFTLEALSALQTQTTTSNLAKALIKLPQVKFIIYKSDALENEISFIDLEKEIIANKALAIAKQLKGKYVTTMDLFIAYLLLTEDKTKFLFNKKLKDEDIRNILIWARNNYTKEETPIKKDTSFAGEGVAEEWIYGWTLETKKYMLDLSHEFINEENIPVGRQNEYKQMVEALYKGKSVILVGDTGSGKESAVKELAIESYMGKFSGNLFHQKIFQLMVDAFMAGAQTQGELETRLDAMIEEVAHSGNVIVYIPEFQNILGSSTFQLDISGTIIPHLQKSRLRIIAAITPGAYKKYVEPMHSLLDAFTVVNFADPPKNEVIDMLFRKAKSIEDKDKVTITYKAVLAAAEYAGKYAKEKVLPGSAVSLLEDSSNSVKVTGKKLVEEQDILDEVERKINVSVGDPKPVEKKLLLNLETELHKRIIDQNEAVFAISEAIRRLRTGLKTVEKPISFLFLGPTGVGKTETAKALAQVYFGNSTRLVRLDMSEFSGPDGMKRLLGSGPGEGDEKGQLTEPIYDSPYSLILLDEFEKADQKILDLFLQVLDDGRLTDNKGRTVSFVNTIIIATSNAGSEYIREEVGKGTLVDKKFQTTLLNLLQQKSIFKPELLNRFDDIIIFKPLGINEVTQIVKLIILELSNRLLEKDIKVSFDDKILNKISNEGFDKEFGARPLRRYVQNNIEDLIAQKMLKDEIKRGDKLIISVDTSNNISITQN